MRRSSCRTLQSYTPPSAVVFDLVGAVLGGSEAVARAWTAAFQTSGIAIDVEAADDILGLGDAAGAFHMLCLHKPLSGPAPEDVAGVCSAFRRELVRLCRHRSGALRTPGWMKVTKALAAHDIPVAVATHLDRGTALELVACCLPALTVPVVSMTDAEDAQGTAGPLHAALRQLGVIGSTSQAVWVSDSPSVLARYPEVRAWGVDTGWVPAEATERWHRAEGVLEDLDDLLDVLSLRARRVEMD